MAPSSLYCLFRLLGDSKPLARLQRRAVQVIDRVDFVDRLLDIAPGVVRGSDRPERVSWVNRNVRVALGAGGVEPHARERRKRYDQTECRQRDRRHEREPFAPYHDVVLPCERAFKPESWLPGPYVGPNIRSSTTF